MRVVLYTHDMEPITVIELSQWAYEFLQKNRQVRLPVYQPVEMTVPSDPIHDSSWFWVVQLTAETLHRNGEEHMMLFMRDEEQALMLKSAFLPGQRGTLRDEKRDAFAKGFLFAISRIGE